MQYDHEKVTMARRRAGLKQWQVAELKGLRGPQLSRRETGKDPFTIRELKAIADLCGVDLDAFAPDDPAGGVSK